MLVVISGNPTDDAKFGDLIQKHDLICGDFLVRHHSCSWKKTKNTKCCRKKHVSDMAVI